MLQKWNSNIPFNYIVACSKFSAKMRFDVILNLRAVVPGSFKFSSHFYDCSSSKAIKS